MLYKIARGLLLSFWLFGLSATGAILYGVASNAVWTYYSEMDARRDRDIVRYCNEMLIEKNIINSTDMLVEKLACLATNGYGEKYVAQLAAR